MKISYRSAGAIGTGVHDANTAGSLPRRVQLRDMASQHPVQLLQLRAAGKRLVRVPQCRGNKAQKIRVALDTVDIDEAAGVLQLALDRQQVEHLPEPALRQRRSAQGEGALQVV